MGGRGARFGTSVSGKPYRTEYSTVLASGNIKFVKYNDSTAATAPMETMTKGRVYVTVNSQDELFAITYYDKNNQRYKQIDLTRPHIMDGHSVLPHVHKGYEHAEKGTRELSEKEQKMVDRVKRIWYNHVGR